MASETINNLKRVMDILIIALIPVGWLALQILILPSLGVQT